MLRYPSATKGGATDEEIDPQARVGTDTQEIRNVYDRLKPGSFVYWADSEDGL